jgi:hypothetical protein
MSAARAGAETRVPLTSATLVPPLIEASNWQTPAEALDRLIETDMVASVATTG